MHPVQATDAIQWAEMRHQDQVRQAELNQRASDLRQPAASHITATALVAHPLWMAVVVLMAVLAVAAV